MQISILIIRNNKFNGFQSRNPNRLTFNYAWLLSHQ